MLTRKDFYAAFGFKWGSILFHKLAAPMSATARLALFTLALELGAEHVYIMLTASQNTYVH